MPPNLGAMTVTTRPRFIRRKKVRTYSGRGEVYAWLRVHHTQVARLLTDDQHPWADIIAEMVADRLRDDRGGELSNKAVTRVWNRVCRDVEAASEKKAATKRPKAPSRISPDWRPTIVSPATNGGAASSYSTTRTFPAAALLALTINDLPTIDPTGAPLEDGRVFYRNKSMPRRAAEQLLKLDQQAKQIDRHK
jgi:hypothetical protein